MFKRKKREWARIRQRMQLETKASELWEICKVGKTKSQIGKIVELKESSKRMVAPGVARGNQTGVVSKQVTGLIAI